MTRPQKLKSVCFKCKVSKWATDFKEGCYSELSSMSVCLFCDLKEEIEVLKTKDRENNRIIQDLRTQILEMKKYLDRDNTKQGESEGSSVDQRYRVLDEICLENRKDIIETGQQVVEIRKEIASLKDRNSFQVVKGRKFEAKDRKESIPLRNRFLVLEDELEKNEDDDELNEKDICTYVIGTSIVGEQKFHFGMKNNRQRERRIVKSFPGCKVKKVMHEVNALKVKNKKVCVIASAGGNDLFKKHNEVGHSEPLIKDLKNLVDALSNKSKKGILIGILPRRYVSHYANCEAIAINDQISKYCTDKNVNFVDAWNIFYGNWHFFNRDGIHLNRYGHRKLSEIMKLGYDRVKSFSCESTELAVQPQEKITEANPTVSESNAAVVQSEAAAVDSAIAIINFDPSKVETNLSPADSENLEELRKLFDEPDPTPNFDGFPN